MKGCIGGLKGCNGVLLVFLKVVLGGGKLRKEVVNGVGVNGSLNGLFCLLSGEGCVGELWV